jgi:outer membrane lipoprotein carrier protein
MRNNLRIACQLLLVIALASCPSGAKAAPELEPGRVGASGPALKLEDSAELSASEIVGRVQARYDQTATLSGRFVQEVSLGATGRVIRSGGTLQFHKPGRMRWEYEGPDPQILIADGETLWIYQPADAQVLRAPLAQAFASSTPVSFLFGVARLAEDFTAERQLPASDGSLRLRLQPKASEEGAEGALVLEVDPVSYDLRAAVVRDPLGNRTRVALVGLHRNLPLADSLFVFERPPGTDVQQAPSGR